MIRDSQLHLENSNVAILIKFEPSRQEFEQKEDKLHDISPQVSSKLKYLF